MIFYVEGFAYYMEEEGNEYDTRFQYDLDELASIWDNYPPDSPAFQIRPGNSPKAVGRVERKKAKDMMPTVQMEFMFPDEPMVWQYECGYGRDQTWRSAGTRKAWTPKAMSKKQAEVYLARMDRKYRYHTGYTRQLTGVKKHGKR